MHVFPPMRPIWPPYSILVVGATPHPIVIHIMKFLFSWLIWSIQLSSWFLSPSHPAPSLCRHAYRVVHTGTICNCPTRVGQLHFIAAWADGRYIITCVKMIYTLYDLHVGRWCRGTQQWLWRSLGWGDIVAIVIHLEVKFPRRKKSSAGHAPSICRLCTITTPVFWICWLFAPVVWKPVLGQFSRCLVPKYSSFFWVWAMLKPRVRTSRYPSWSAAPFATSRLTDTRTLVRSGSVKNAGQEKNFRSSAAKRWRRWWPGAVHTFLGN